MRVRILALGGAAGPVLFTVVVLVCAGLRTDYNHTAQVMSVLGETGGPTELLMNAVGFIPTGLLILGFAFSLSRLVPSTALATTGAILLGLFGLGIVGAGTFSCDLGCPRVDTSREAFLHIAFSVLAFPSGVTACACWGFAFRSLPAWRPISSFALASAFVSAVLLLTFSAAAGSSSIVGVWQRLFLGSLFLWCIVVGIYAFRTSAQATHTA